MGEIGTKTIKQSWTLHEMMIPAGKTAKLIRIKDISDPDFRITEVCDKLKIIKPAPVIILAGAMTQRAYIIYYTYLNFIEVKLWQEFVEQLLGLMLIFWIQE